MKTKILIAIAALSFAAPAFAQSTSMLVAIEHFNQSADTAAEVIAMPVVSEGRSVSTDGNSAMAVAMELVGEDELGSVTVYPNDPAYAADVFATLAAQ